MAVEIYEGSYRGHSIYYYQYEAGGVYRVSDVSGTFETITEAKAAIDEAEGAAQVIDRGPQGPPTPGLVEVDEYRGVIIYEMAGDTGLVFSIYHAIYTSYLGIADAKATIDGVLGPILPGEPGYVTPITPEPGKIGFPPLLGWIGDVLNWGKGVWDGSFNALIAYSKAVSGAGSAVSAALSAIPTVTWTAISNIPTVITALGDLVWSKLIDRMAEIFTKSSEASISRALKILPEAMGQSPEYKTEIENTLRPFANDAIQSLLDAVNPEKYVHSTLSPDEAAGQLNVLGATVAAANIGIWIAHTVAEAATLGQLEAVGQLSNIVVSSLGVNALSARALMIPIEKSILIPAEMHYNEVYTPEIPSYQDLINQVVKEVISLDEFKAKMKLLGYNETWSQRIWDAHFIAPSLNDILTAWRRGLIDEGEVDRLMILVDLDPRFKNIFDTRKYVDPPLSVTRFMYEEGVITPGQVREYVALQGYRPEHVDNITKYITEFQERLWRRRYLTTLSSGYIKGVYASGDLQKAVVDAGYSEGVASWIVANADARKKIDAAKVVEEKPKLLGIGDMKVAYLRNLVDAAKLRVDLGVRGYSYDDVELLIKVLDEQKVVTSAGGRKVALSEGELIKAWQFSKITEPRLRIELTTRGLSMEEIDILEATKLAEWAAGGKPSPEEEIL